MTGNQTGLGRHLRTQPRPPSCKADCPVLHDLSEVEGAPTWTRVGMHEQCSGFGSTGRCRWCLEKH